MTDYKKYINALRKCAKEHEDDRTSFGHIIVSDLCRDTANLLESLEQESTDKENLVVGDCISRQAVLDLVEDMTDQFGVEHRVITEGVISMLPPVTPKPKTDVLDKIRAEIKEWYWQADKQALAEDPCVVDAMIDLFIRTIDKYKAESEDKE